MADRTLFHHLTAVDRCLAGVEATARLSICHRSVCSRGTYFLCSFPFQTHNPRLAWNFKCRPMPVVAPLHSFPRAPAQRRGARRALRDAGLLLQLTHAPSIYAFDQFDGRKVGKRGNDDLFLFLRAVMARLDETFVVVGGEEAARLAREVKIGT